MSWSISVKTVGGIMPSVAASPPINDPETETETSTTEKPQPTNFVVNVEPEDLLSSLHKKIEDVTGLKTSQQRLIYRGRIISGGSKKSDENLENNAQTVSDDTDSRLCDVAGLGSGQTIHLVPRPVESDTVSPTPNSASETNPTPSSTSSSNDAGNASVELLAALLGIGSGGLSAENEDNEESNTTETDLGTLFSLPRTRVARSSARRRRANSHRRIANDPRHPEPGSLEPVRQGMMTLHTMTNSKFAPIAETETVVASTETTEEITQNYRPLDASRTWYRGQWIDCRDTVNQWLEATVVDIVSPKDILNSLANNKIGTQTSTNPTPDPAVGANDFEGRRRLLLKMTENELDEELAKENGGDEDLIGFRERDNNHGVQLLLIHYNGWPHRWDEWIRSDSERIRPFRTRSRHTPNRSIYASPTPQSVFHASPATYFKEESETCERAALIPELYRTILAVNNLVSEAIPADTHDQIKTQSEHIGSNDQPWMPHDQNEKDKDESMSIDEFAEKIDDVKCDDKESQQVAKFDKRKLDALAPLLDRLGRILTDAAPHVASFADSLPGSRIQSPNVPDEATEPIEPISDVDQQIVDSSTTPLLSSLSSANIATEDDPVIEENENDPDYVDFVNGFVNVASNDRSISGRSSTRRLDRDDDAPSNIGSSLLSAYLASSGSSNANSDNNGEDGNANGEENGNGNGNNRAPRVLRLGGGNNDGGGLGPGIDIHIHAIVTGPGGGVGGGTAGLGGLAGLAAMGMPLNLGATVPSSRPNTTARPITSTITPSVHDDDDDGLFSDLYSESPAPVNLSPPPHTSNSWETQTVQNSSSEPMEIDESNDAASDNELDDLPPLEPAVVLPLRPTTSNDMPALLDDRAGNRNSSGLESTATNVSDNDNSLDENTYVRTSGEPRTAFGRFFRRTLGRRHNSGT